jgi:putative endonuclease
VSRSKRFVYVLRSELDPSRYYSGLTSDISATLEAHNAGRCAHTTNGRPWRVDVVVEFADEARAVRFERYLKSGSGNAFAKHHLRTQVADDIGLGCCCPCQHASVPEESPPIDCLHPPI